MSQSIEQIAATAVLVLAPFTPFLLSVAKVGGKKLVEAVAEKGGEAAWTKAQNLWHKLSKHFGNDPELNSATTLLATKPDDATRQELLIAVLIERLKTSPEVIQELVEALGGNDSIQTILAEHGSWVENVVQRMQGKGTQSIKATDDSVVKDVRQSID